MIMDFNDHCLNSLDIAFIERLSGHKLADEFKDYLLVQYGPSSDYQKIRLQIKAAMDDCRYSSHDDCDNCYACAFDPGDSLLERVFKTVISFNRGHFDILKHDYNHVCSQFCFHIVGSNDADSPF